MATTFKWASLGVTRTLIRNATSLSALGNAAFAGLSAAITNSTGLYQYIDLELFVKVQGSARTAGGYVSIYINQSLDAFTTGEDSGNTAFTNQVLCTFQLDAATTARRLIISNIPIPPLDFKLDVYNNTGQVFATDTNDATGSTLYYALHNEQGV